MGAAQGTYRAPSVFVFKDRSIVFDIGIPGRNGCGFSVLAVKHGQVIAALIHRICLHSGNLRGVRVSCYLRGCSGMSRVKQPA